MARDETPDTHPTDDAIMRNRREAFVDGYNQAVGDVQSWATMQGGPTTLFSLLVLMKDNAEKYKALLADAHLIDKGIAEAEAGETVDRGDFTQFLDEEIPAPTTDEILADAAQAARRFGAEKGTVLPGLMANLFDLAASDLSMCERQNSRDPDNDGKTLILPQPFVSLAVDMAREALLWWKP